MRVAGSFAYVEDLGTVYATFTDRDALLVATPGLRSLIEVQPDAFDAVLSVGIGGFALVYRGRLTVTDRQHDRGYRLLVDAQTHNGFGRGEATFAFRPRPEGGTLVEYDADVELGGAQKLLPTLARGLVEFFMRGMAEVLLERRTPHAGETELHAEP